VNLDEETRVAEGAQLLVGRYTAPHTAHSAMCSFSLRWPLATCGPLAKRSPRGKGSVAASLGCPVQAVDDPAPTGATGSALVQVAVSSHPDEREAGAASRALYSRRERMKPHVKLWHPFTPSPPASGYMPDSISRRSRSSQRSELRYAGGRDARDSFGMRVPGAVTENRPMARRSLAVLLVLEVHASIPLLRPRLHLGATLDCADIREAISVG
jgi:hypothetical protein